MRRISTPILLSVLVVAPVVAQATAAALNPNAAADELFVCPRPLPTVDDYRAMAERNVILDPQAATLVALSWNAGCSPYPVDYAIYAGDLGNFNVRSPVTCTTAGSTSYEDHVPAAGSRYFLVVPKSDTLEGSHGHNSAGAERNEPAGSCEPKAVDLSCP